MSSICIEEKCSGRADYNIKRQANCKIFLEKEFPINISKNNLIYFLNIVNIYVLKINYT